MARRLYRQLKDRRAQTIVEYCIVFAVVVAIIALVATGAFRESLQTLYGKVCHKIRNLNP